MLNLERGRRTLEKVARAVPILAVAIAALALPGTQAFANPVAPVPTHESSQIILSHSQKELEPKNLVCPIDYWHEVQSEQQFEAYVYNQITQGHYFVSMKQLTDYFYDGVQTWPEDKKPRVITFDDGLLSQFNNALPVLNRWKIPATFFVMPDYQGDGVHDYMINDNFKILADSGQEVGSHTMDHRPLNQLRKTDTNAWRDEIIMSKKRLEDIMGREVVSFSYPYGRNGIDPETIDLVSQYYKIAVTTGGNIPYLKSSQIFELPRGWRS